MARHNDIGKLGEDIACEFLRRKGFTIITRNYTRKWGEIDIVARDTSGIYHFIEVKSTERHYTCNHDNWDPVEMVHHHKIERLKRVIQTYLLETDIEEWVFDVIVVYLDTPNRNAKCKFIKDIIL